MEQEVVKLPTHMGIIIDGNGRWAQAKGLPRSMGHEKGKATLEKILKECYATYKIPIVSIFAFSSENWNRPQNEVDYLMNLLGKVLNTRFAKKYPDVRINVIGDVSRCPEAIAKKIKKIMEQTKDNAPYTLNLAISYGGQDEIINAVNKAIENGATKITKEVLEQNLYTAGQPPIDFLIRTSGEQRVSNFMLWQMAYAEMYFPKVNWPAFTKKDLHKALLVYQSRDRRFGNVKK